MMGWKTTAFFQDWFTGIGGAALYEQMSYKRAYRWDKYTFIWVLVTDCVQCLRW